VYVFLVVGLRLAGKRELAQLNPFDLVVLLTLSNAVQNAIIGDDNSITGGVIGAATLLLVNHWVVRYLYSHERIDRLVQGDADVLIDHGVVNIDHLKRELITMSEFESAAHKQGFASLEEVDRAILEPGGTICFFAKKPTPEVERHKEVVARLEQISKQLAALQSKSVDRRVCAALDANDRPTQRTADRLDAHRRQAGTFRGRPERHASRRPRGICEEIEAQMTRVQRRMSDA
jgi:uncharacterized membrane protein YcaP (DUF421 family)